MSAPIHLPPIRNPQRYVGLYVYDFGDYVAVGYTAAEVAVLRESKEYRSGVAYQIYRATQQGGFELRGVLDERLHGLEAMCFLRDHAAAAREDYDSLCQAANRHRLPCAAELRLAKVYDFTPSHVTALVYPVASGAGVSNWLIECAFAGGDHVIGGRDAFVSLQAGNAVDIASCKLPAPLDYTDRSAAEVLGSTHDPIQR